MKTLIMTVFAAASLAAVMPAAAQTPQGAAPMSVAAPVDKGEMRKADRPAPAKASLSHKRQLARHAHRMSKRLHHGHRAMKARLAEAKTR